MPCSDVTELIRVVLDAGDRLTDYRFVKQTCGQAVGAQSLLLDHFRGLTADELLAVNYEQLLAQLAPKEDLEEFLYLKHLFAVQSALDVLTGKEPGGPNDPCAAAEISVNDGELVVSARIVIELMTEKIKSCGNCGSCGKSKKKTRKTQRAAPSASVVLN